MNSFSLTAFYDTLFGILKEGIIITDTHNEVLYANQSAIRILKTKADSLIGYDLPFDPTSKSKRFEIRKKGRNAIFKAFSKRTTYEGRKVKIIKILPVENIVETTGSNTAIDFYQKIIRQSNTGICVAERNGDIIEWNSYLEELTSLKSDKVMGRKLWEVLAGLNPETDKEQIRHDLNRYMKSGKSGDTFGEFYDHKIITPAGEERFVHENFFSIRNNGSLALCGFITDVTDFRKMEKSIQNSERLFREILGSTRHYIYRFNAKEDRYDYISPHIRELTGYHPEEVLTKNFEEAIGKIHPEDLDKIRDDIDEARRSDLDKISYTWQYRYLTKHGKYRWLADWTTIFFDKDGEIDSFVGSMYDITEQKEAEDKVIKSEHRLRNVLDATSDGVWEYNIIKTRVYLSDNFLKAIGLETESNYVGPDFWENIIHPEDRSAIEEAFEDNFSNRTKNISVECRIKGRNDKWKWFLVRGRLTERDETGQPGKIVGTFTDISGPKQTELELRESEYRFRSIVQESRDGIAMIDEKGYVTSWNKGMEKITGYKAAEVIGKPYWEVTFDLLEEPQQTEEAREQMRVTFKEYLRTGDSELLNKESEIRIVHADGTKRFTHAYYYPVPTEKGFLSANIIRDITRHKQYEKEIRESQELLSGVLNNSRDIIYKMNLRDLSYEFISKSSKDITGYSAEEMVEMGPLGMQQKMLHPDDLEKYGNLPARLAELEKGRNSSFILEYRIKSKQGNYIYFSDYFTVIFEDGKASYLIGSMRDVTEKKRTEAEIKESRQRYRHLVENINDLVVQVDSNNRFVFVSPSYCEMFGKTERQLLGRTFFPLVHKDDVEKTRRAMESLKEYPYTCYVEQRALTKDGWRWFAWSDKAILDDYGNISRIIGVGRDITERKKTEEKLNYRMKFETLLTELSTEFIKAPLSDLDGQINKALSDIGEFADTDRSYVMLFDGNGVTMSNTHEWCRRGIRPQKEKLQNIDPETELPYLWEKLEKREIVHVPRVYNMPGEASVDRDHLIRQEIKSLISVPIICGGRFIGFLGFDAVSHIKRWTDDNILLLKAVANMLGNVFHRKENESELFKQKELFKSLVENLNDFIWIKDFSNQPVYISPGGTRLLGYSTEELIEMARQEKGYRKYIAPSSIELYESIIEDKEKYIREILNNPDFTKKIELEYIRKDSKRIWCESTLRVIKGKDNKPQMILGITRDITPHVVANRTLADRNRKFMNIVESYTHPTIIVTTDGVVEYLNPRAEQFFGFDLENVPRIEEWFDSFGDPEISARAHDLWKYIQNTYPVHVEKIVSARIQSGDFERIKLRALSLDSEKVLIICDKADEE